MTDDDLRAQLRRADPAASLTPITPDRVPRLLEDAMSSTVIEKKKPAAPMWLAAAAVALVAVGGATVAIGGWPGGSGTPPGQVAAPPAKQDPQQQPVVARINAGSGAQAKCIPPSPEFLRPVDLAFEGTVTGIVNGLVTLDVVKVWSGERADVVEIAQTDGATEALLAGTHFEVGETYLVAAEDGQAKICGYSGVASPELRALYDAAF